MIDSDQSGYIHEHEFITYHGHEDWVREVFHEMDTNGDGMVEPCEWKVYAAYMYNWV